MLRVLCVLRFSELVLTSRAVRRTIIAGTDCEDMWPLSTKRISCSLSNLTGTKHTRSGDSTTLSALEKAAATKVTCKVRIASCTVICGREVRCVSIRCTWEMDLGASSRDTTHHTKDLSLLVVDQPPDARGRAIRVHAQSDKEPQSARSGRDKQDVVADHAQPAVHRRKVVCEQPEPHNATVDLRHLGQGVCLQPKVSSQLAKQKNNGSTC